MYIENGFCDYEKVVTKERGTYSWSETYVGLAEPLVLNCEYNNDSYATRYCRSHRDWKDIDLSDCITLDTFQLQILATDVRVSDS